MTPDDWQIMIAMSDEDEPEPALLCADTRCGCQEIGKTFGRDVRVILYAGQIEYHAIDEEFERHLRRTNISDPRCRP